MAVDVAFIEIAAPHVAPMPVSREPIRIGQRLHMAGFGTDGRFRQASGAAMTVGTPDGGLQDSSVALQLTGRPGDSGGPVFDDQGRVRAVFWGSVPGQGQAMQLSSVWDIVFGDRAIAPWNSRILSQRICAQPPPGTRGVVATPPDIADLRQRLSALEQRTDRLEGELGAVRNAVPPDVTAEVSRLAGTVERVQGHYEAFQTDGVSGAVRSVLWSLVSQYGWATGIGAVVLVLWLRKRIDNKLLADDPLVVERLADRIASVSPLQGRLVQPAARGVRRVLRRAHGVREDDDGELSSRRTRRRNRLVQFVGRRREEPEEIIEEIIEEDAD
jgi:hypothetical protein